MMRRPLPNYDGERHEADASHRGPDGIDSRHLASAQVAGFFLLFVFFQERRRRREDRGECQKQPSYFRAISLGNQPGKHRDGGAEGKTHRVFVPFRAPQRSEIDLDFQRASQRSIPSAAPNQMTSASAVTGRAAHFCRIMRRLATDA